MTKEKKHKNRNTFSVLQGEDTVLLWEEEELPQNVKIDKICKEKGRARIRRAQNKKE